jgi:tetratricopeptide (TPR) repeat protein
MSNNEESDLIIIRKYLLCELSGAELEQLEERIIGDNSFFDQILAEEEKMIDEYICEKMTPQSRERFEGSYLLTPEGREQVNLARNLTENITSRQSKKTAPAVIPSSSFFAKSFLNQFMKVAASIIIICGLPLAVWRFYFYQSDVDAGMTALNHAYNKQRTIEVRPTGIDYAPMSTRGEQDAIDSLLLSRAENYLRSAVSHKPDEESHHALGRLYLMEKDFDKAIEEYKIALNVDEHNPKIHNDLGAAFLEKAKAEAESGTGHSKEMMLESLKHLNRAIELDNSLAEAFFNRGLLYKEMGEAELAIADWNKYLDKDSESKWSEEIKNKIKLLNK